MLFRLLNVLFFTVFTIRIASAQSGDGYVGYSLTERGDAGSAVYETADTSANVSTTDPPPDVYLNASVSVGEIDIEVDDLSAQVNLQASVLSLLKFNAGVDVSIEQVSLQIQNISAKVLLEARLGNVVTMIGDVLNSIDLNPVIATLGNDVGQIVNNTVGGLTGSGSGSTGTNGTNVTARGLSSQDYDLEHGILYSINDYSGNTHTNRVLQQDGSIVDESLNNDGVISSTTVVGSYATDMSFTGYNHSTTFDGVSAFDQEYSYTPAPGIIAICAVYTDSTGKVLGTSVVSETRGGGGSTIAGELKQ